MNEETHGDEPYPSPLTAQQDPSDSPDQPSKPLTHIPPSPESLFDLRLEKAEERFGRIEEEVKKVEEGRIKTIEIVGILVALFTFISTNIQIFNNVTDLTSALIFTTILATLTILIMIVMKLILHPIEKPLIKWLLGWILPLIIVLGLFFIGLHYDRKYQPKLNQYKEFSHQTETKTIEVEIKNQNPISETPSPSPTTPILNSTPQP